MVLPFFSPAELILGSCGDPEEAKNLAGRVLRLIQIRLATPSLEKSRLLVYRALVCQVSSYGPAIGSSDFLNETHRKPGSPIRVP